MRPIPPKNELEVLFAHVAYRFAERFEPRQTGIRFTSASTLDEAKAAIPRAHVLVCSGLWRNEFITSAPKLAFVQSCSAGTDQYDKAAMKAAGIRLASAQGVNERAVAEHAISLVLALARRLHLLRDAQAQRTWRGMLSDLVLREEELGGKTMLIVGMGRIGSRLAEIAKAFDMRVIATKRNPATAMGPADKVVPDRELLAVLPEADFVVLTCPLTPETERLIDARALAAMRPDAYLINVARGKVVDEPALIQALERGQIAGAGLDCTVEEPLPASSALWAMPNVIVTPHTAGETRKYEDNTLDMMLENLDRLWRGETALKNGMVE
jgi:D-2-hydroxyacid dehydrogenase (NADP+)